MYLWDIFLFAVCGLLEKGIAAIFGPQDPMTSLHVESICDEVEVPHVETRWEHKPKRDALSINLYPSSTVLSQNYIAMVKYMDWQNFTLLYDEHEGKSINFFNYSLLKKNTCIREL